MQPPPNTAPATSSGDTATPLGPATPTRDTTFAADVSGRADMEAFVFFSFHPTLCVWCLLCPCVAGGFASCWGARSCVHPPKSRWMFGLFPGSYKHCCSMHPWPRLAEQVSFHRWGQSPQWLDHLSPHQWHHRSPIALNPCRDFKSQLWAAAPWLQLLRLITVGLSVFSWAFSHGDVPSSRVLVLVSCPFSGRSWVSRGSSSPALSLSWWCLWNHRNLRSNAA